MNNQCGIGSRISICPVALSPKKLYIGPADLRVGSDQGRGRDVSWGAFLVRGGSSAMCTFFFSFSVNRTAKRYVSLGGGNARNISYRLFLRTRIHGFLALWHWFSVLSGAIGPNFF
jgi:hypothetical protein